MALKLPPLAPRSPTTRRSRCLVRWRAQDGLTALTGQTVTFDRNGRNGRGHDSEGVVGPLIEAYDVPRYEVAGGEVGLLIEQSSSNHVLYSEDFGNAAWTKTRSSIATNTTLTRAPDRSFTADRWIEDTSVTTDHYISQGSVTITAGEYVLLGLYVKPYGRTKVQMQAASGADRFTCTFDLVAQTVVTGVQGTSTVSGATVTALDDGWFRCEVGGKVNAASTTFAFNVVGMATTTTYTGDGASGYFLWGAWAVRCGINGITRQSYLGPTVGSVLTRTTDQCTMALSASMVPEELTIYVRFLRPGWLDYAQPIESYKRLLVLSTTPGAYLQLYFQQLTSGFPLAVGFYDGATYVSRGALGSSWPAGAVLDCIAQVKDLRTTGGKVSCDMGNGLNIFTTATTVPISAWGNGTLWVGSSGSSALLDGAMVEVKLASGLWTLQQMREMP